MNWILVWRRLRRDRWTMAAIATLAGVVAVSLVGGAIATRVLGHGGDKPFPYATIGDGPVQKPVGIWSHVPDTAQVRLDEYSQMLPPAKGTKTTLFVLGGDGTLGRDEFIRLLDGGRTSIEVGIGGVLFALLVALPVGAAAGYFGGLLDAAVGRFTDTVMAFPMLLFLVFATAKLSPYLAGVGYSWIVPRGVFSDALLIGVFTCFYPMRLFRAQLMTLRHAEFVEAAQMIGASDWRILRRELASHLVPTMLVWGAIAVATNMLLEVSLSFIGVGVQPSTPTWGSMLAVAWGSIYAPRSANPTIWLTLCPTAALVVTVLALNQLSEGFRRALEPRH
ncbi:MAG TPA: ABC transporter permease [Gaiellaceae bacterium]